MRILFLVHSFNSLAQRLYVELAEAGHELSVEYDINDETTREAVALFRPDVVLAPFLKRAIPEDVWRALPCLVVHPGVRGDRGPNALDWAILRREQSWGVTIIEAEAEMDAGPVWAWREFEMRHAPKSSIYRNEVTETAVITVFEALAMIEARDFRPTRLDLTKREIQGTENPPVRQADRRINWHRDTSMRVARMIHSGDGTPGLLDEIDGVPYYHYDARPWTGREHVLGARGAIVAKSGPAIARGTRNGLVWIGHLSEKRERALKLPATTVLAGRLDGVPEIEGGYREIWYEEEGQVGYLHFAFYNGAMSTDQCRRLAAAYKEARARPTRVLVLMGGADFWSNGIHLGTIEAAESPADESLANIEAMDDLALAILTTEDKIVVSALRGNAGAGGAFLALAADEVWARSGIVLNPHYKDMGNLYGSEYWTYLLPKRVGAETAAAIAARRLPIGVAEALRLKLVDRALPNERTAAEAEIRQRARELATREGFSSRLWDKRIARGRDEKEKPLAAYRAEELEKMHLNFYGFDSSYHVARFNFIHKVPKSRTPLTLARHRAKKG